MPVEPLPLSGRSIVVTRAAAQASPLRERLVALGADVIDVPVIAIEPIDAELAARAERVDWIVVTSPNAAVQVREALVDPRVLDGTRVAAIGPGTARVLEDCGVQVDLVPAQNVGEGLVDAFPGGPGRVVLVQGAEARRVVADGLRDKGWRVDVAAAYQTVGAELTEQQRAATTTADAITFTSSSTVTNFVAVAGLEAVPPAVVCIGPVTAATALALGISPSAVADPHTLDGLVEAVLSALGS